MLICMRTSVDVQDRILKQLKQLPETKNMTFKQIVESALTLFIKQIESSKKHRFKLQDGSAGEGGMQPEFDGASWPTFRDEIYRR